MERGEDFMEEQVLNDDVAKKFLLGQLSPEEQGHIEELAFDNPETFVFLQAAESDLIDEFLDDDLSAEEKERFRQHFLKQPGRRADLRVARAMQQYLSHKSRAVVAEPKVIDPYKSPPLREWMAQHLSSLTASLAVAALIVVAIGIAVLIYVMGQKDRERLEARHDQPTPVPTATASSTATASPSSSPAHQETPNKPPSTPRPPAPAAFAIVLSPRLPLRSEGEEDLIRMPSATVPLELPLVDKGAFRSYLAELQKDEKTIHRWPNLQPGQMTNGKGFQIYMSPGLLKPDQSYRIVLSGISASGGRQPLRHYNFRVSPSAQP
jgi:hypothetical protein